MTGKTCLGVIYRSGIKVGTYTFDTIGEHKKYMNIVYDSLADVRIKYNDIDVMSYGNANNIGDVLYSINSVNSRHIDSEITKAILNLSKYDDSDISRRLIKIGNDMRD
jgi:hypothetical protein